MAARKGLGQSGGGEGVILPPLDDIPAYMPSVRQSMSGPSQAVTRGRRCTVP